MQSNGQMQCKDYDSMLALPSDLQAARAYVVISILVVLMGILLAVVGGKCIEDEASKSKVAIAVGVIFIVGGILCLIPVCWSAHVIIRNFYFYDPNATDGQRRELGASLFIGWGSAGLLLIGGSFLCCGIHLDLKYAANPEIKFPIVILPSSEVPDIIKPPPAAAAGYEASGDRDRGPWSAPPQAQPADPRPPYGGRATHPPSNYTSAL
ncbi:Claudin-like protein ZF-A89 [Liparis tanakae]|uniref:Claudin-like protein ZF-A89 n=1 Tax=Liparis tanakae TaxID=230148 RepID=A0A4Z2G582_9TELE|nr:Claudin-like protein ZF-A89 [Liparis tanakae]